MTRNHPYVSYYAVIMFDAFAILHSYYVQNYVGIIGSNLRITEVVTSSDIPYRTKLWRGENFSEFGESPQFAKFFRQHSR